MDLVKTPRTLSPYMLVQEFLRDEPWKLLVAVIMLNQTSAKQMYRVLPEFFERWPVPEDFIMSDEREVKDLIRPLGFVNRRHERLLWMTCEFLAGIRPPQKLYGIGKYGEDSFNMFCRGYLVQGVQDKELRHYVRWAEEQRRTAGRDSEHRGIQPDLPASPQTLAHSV